MRALITGAAGFVGQHLLTELNENGHEAVGTDRRWANSELKTPGLIEEFLDALKPEVVIHLAAKVGRLLGEDDLLETIADNAGVTALVARACGERGIRLVYTSTSEIYGDQGDHSCSELNGDMYAALPHNAYGLTKRQGEEFCQLYAPRGLTIFRLSMPFGPGLPAGRGRAAIVNMLDQASNRQTIPVHRGSERSWCWIGDTVRAMRMVLETTDGVWNVGRDDNPTPMRRVAEIACDLTDAPHDLIEEIDAPGRQTVVKRLNTERLRALGWKPEVELAEGMALTLAAMREADTTWAPEAGVLGSPEVQAAITQAVKEFDDWKASA
jgi:nucleoside-diphosphate-sugar epimerase